MIEIANAIKEGKWAVLAIVMLLLVVTMSVPLATQKLVGDEVREIISQTVTPVLEDTQESVQALENHNVLSLRNSAIVAYNKIFVVEDLQPLTQNGLAIRDGLQVSEIREALFTLDPERTLLFEAYFAGE